MMKKYLLIALMSFFIKGHSQFQFANDNYYNCLESSYQMSYGIALASIGGDYQKANALLNTPYFINNSEDAALIKALLSYNTKGEKFSFKTIDASSKSLEQKDFSKLWLSFYAKNLDDYETRITDFQEKHRENYSVFKLKFRAILDYRDAHIWNPVYDDKQKALFEIDSLLNLTKLSKEDKLFFSLIKLDFLSKEAKNRLENTKDIFYSKDESIAKLIAIWKEDRFAFNFNYLLTRISDCITEECMEAKVFITNELIKNDDSTSAEKVYTLLMNNDLRLDVPKMESLINGVAAKEKNAEQSSQINGLIALFSLSKLPHLGIFSQGLLKPIALSKEFKARYSTPQNKTVVLQKIKEIFNSPELEQFRQAPGLKENFEKEFETLKSLSTQDVQAVYGLLVFSTYFTKSMKQISAAFGNLSDGLTLEDRNDYKKFIAFFDKNPLFFEKSRHWINSVKFNSEQEVFAFITESQKLHEKYPAALPVIEGCMFSLAQANTLVTKNEAQKYYSNYLKLVIDAYKVNFSKEKLDTKEKQFYYFGLIQNHYHAYSGDNYISEFLKLLSDDSKLQAQNYLKKSLMEYPKQKDLKVLHQLINESFGAEKYLDHYLINTDFEDENGKVDTSILLSLDSVYITNKLQKEIKSFKGQNNFDGLKKTIPVLYFISEYDNAFDLLLYILKNDSSNTNFNDPFSQTCLQELYETTDEEECIQKMTKIQKEFPKFELNYLYTIAIKLGNEDLRKEALQMLQDYSRQDFYPSGSDLSKYIAFKNYLAESYFDEENIRLIFKEIGKKYPAVLNQP